ncbi:MAG: flavin reductase family protein [Dehalococcoidia bacterium]
MVRCLCDETDARRLLNPGPLTIVTSAWRGMTNAAPVAWTAPLSMEPPLVGCVIHPNRHTADMIRFSEEFALNIPGPRFTKQAAFLGSLSGLNFDKIEASGLETFPAMRIDAPLLAGCLAWIECGLQDVVPNGDHSLFVGRVIRVQALDEAYAGKWLLAAEEFSPLTYIGGTSYGVVGSPHEAEFSVDERGVLISETPEEREEREEREARAREIEQAEGTEGVEQRLRAEEG